MSYLVVCPVCRVPHSNEEWRDLGALCARCGKHSRTPGSALETHYMPVCQVTGEWVGMHSCCPGNCSRQH